MSTAKLTLIGLYNHDTSIFDQLTLPDGIDNATIINNILLRSGDFEVMYPDPDFLKPAIGVWAKKWERTFERWINALNVNYDPLNNYDRTEEWTINEDVDDSESHSETANGTRSESAAGEKSEQSTNTENTTNTTNTNEQINSSNQTNTNDQATTGSNETSLDKVSAYNSATLQNDKQREVTISGTSSATGTTTATGTETSTGTEASTGSVTGSGTVTGTSSNDIESETKNTVTGRETKERDRTETRKGHAYGNIGVTTSQQMLQAELDIAEWNLYEHITDIFLSEFIIPIY